MRAAVLVAGLIVCGHATTAEAADWAGAALGTASTESPIARPISSDDILQLRDVGGFSVSPNGKMLAFSVYQARPDQNTYVQRWFVQRTDGKSVPAPLAQDGGQPIPAIVYGIPQAVIPRENPVWAPNGTKFAYRRMVDHRIELWIADVATLQSRRVADGVDQVAVMAWSTDDTLVFKTGLNYSLFEENLAAESRHGWLLDSRVMISARMHPNPPDCTANRPNSACRVHSYAVESTGQVRAATFAEEVLLVTPRRDVQTRPNGATVGLASVDPSAKGYQPVNRINTNAPGWKICVANACLGQYIPEFGWARGGHSIWFLKGESESGRLDGAPRDRTGLYEWRESGAVPRRVLSTDDLLQDCSVRDTVVYCLRETTTAPRHIVSINLNDDRVTVLADPNPALGQRRFPLIRKVMLQDPAGNPGFAELVYPANYQPGKRYPLVITEYSTKGFLRGQVGGEYPIFPFSTEGYFVLSVTFPEPWDERKTKDIPQYEQWLFEDNLRYRRGVLSAIEYEIDGLVSGGLVDNDKVAITGLSAGAEIVHYALQHSSRFAAAIASSGIHDSEFLVTLPEGPGRDRLMKTFQSNTLIPADDNVIWKLAWSRMPERLKAPLLINVGEYEAYIGLEGIESLKHAGRPVETRVFPDELHIKYHPQSYKGVFDNNIMWLNFWLKGEEDTRPEFQAQYQRWEAMRQKLAEEKANRVPQH